MAAPSIDERDWPILRITYPVSMEDTDSEFYYRRLKEYLLRRERFALLIDARPAQVPSAIERSQIATFWKETATLSAQFVAGIALVVKTPAGRGVLTAVLWLFEPPFPIRTFVSAQDGWHWLRECLELEPIAAPRSLFPNAPHGS